MRYKIILFFLILFTGSLIFVSSCKKKNEEENKPEFDRKGMLTNIGNNSIIPNYEKLKTALQELDTAVTAFNASPDLTNLSALQNAFKEAYKAWEINSVFEFGPAEQEMLRANLNTFPAYVVKIESNITSNTYSFDDPDNITTKGFPAMDYLLFGVGADNNAILAKYTTDTDAANRRNYLQAISNYIRGKVETVNNAWSPSGGNYINTFINASGTDVGSSLGQLVNQLNQDFEMMRTPKIGIPLGKQTLGSPLPAKAEAYYSGISAELALTQLKAIENIFLGRSEAGVDGSGLDDYLAYLKAPYNGGQLSDAIKNQFTTAITKLQAVPDPLSSTVQNNPAIVDAAYIELQKLLVLLKTDMPSALGVLITYQDNDGD
ncbi:MAG: imelysin family protein [Cytophagaceae bacterium]|nr:imelysin family protein [Cytophagaceae bacterium]